MSFRGISHRMPQHIPQGSYLLPQPAAEDTTAERSLMEMINVINNIEKWTSWDYKAYPLSFNEAKAIIEFYDIYCEQYEEELRRDRDGMDCD